MTNLLFKTILDSVAWPGIFLGSAYFMFTTKTLTGNDLG